MSSDNPDVVTAATYFFHLLINGEAEGVLDSKIFARALIDLVRRCTVTATIVVNERGEANLVELLFEIATKIRLDPDILPAWFYPERDQSRGRLQGAESRRGQFPLFYQLVQYVHHDGPMGDFARTGLLYLTDMASRSKPLEKWMIESDLAPQMASGLSALYSRLSRQAHLLTDVEKAFPIVAFSDIAPEDTQLDDSPEEFDKNVNSFLSYLAFWQDTLNHCKSEEVKDTLLDHFQVLFVQQLLYPSLLESSDVAGGSTSAVVLHLYRMLEALDHPQMARRMLQYLLAFSKPGSEVSKSGHRRGRMSISRRKSVQQLASLADLADSPSPDLFNLLDFVVISLQSKHAQTINANLKLVTIILRRHHHYVLTSLFRTRSVADVDSTQSVGDFNQAMIKLLDLAGDIAQVATIDDSYRAALSDGQILLQRHSCSLHRNEMLVGKDYPVHRQKIAEDCKLFAGLVDLLRSFFTNDSITNILLTETLIALAACEHITLKDWLVCASKEDASASQTILLAVFEELLAQVKQWQSNFAEWDSLFAYQRVKLAPDGEMLDRGNVRSLSLASRGSGGTRTSSPQPVQGVATPAGASTPRGRKAPPAGFGSIDGTLAQSPKLAAASPSIKALAGSPLHQTTFPEEAAENVTATSASSVPSDTGLAQLRQQVKLPDSGANKPIDLSPAQFTSRLKLEDGGSGASTPRTNDVGTGTITPSMQGLDSGRTSASLSHIITNAIILQEFVLEIAAMLQIRATLYDEVNVL